MSTWKEVQKFINEKFERDLKNYTGFKRYLSLYPFYYVCKSVSTLGGFLEKISSKVEYKEPEFIPRHKSDLLPLLDPKLGAIYLASSNPNHPWHEVFFKSNPKFNGQDNSKGLETFI